LDLKTCFGGIDVSESFPIKTNIMNIVKVLKTDYLTANVKRFVVEKPYGYDFISGQATELSINRPGLEDELRPFTFTSIAQSPHLEFIIKIYTGHDGMTEKLQTVNAGDQLILHDVFGTITYKGPGIFIAGGAGITPFISIFRQLALNNELSGNSLLFANRTEADIILRDELKAILGINYRDILEISADAEIPGSLIDRRMLEEYVKTGQHYYICGPDKFVNIMQQNLRELGADDSRIIIEE
jgi:ferredoxin-NADP reductase